jgi:hypothetical protein
MRTKENDEFFIKTYQGLLGLQDWDIRLGDPRYFEFDVQEEAYIYHQDDERVAAIYLHPEANERQAVRLIGHELLHLVFLDLEFVACNGSSVDTMEAFARELERVIAVMTGVLTGFRTWDPISERQKEWYGPAYAIPEDPE